jgi:lipid IVA palmitoyltransferase
MKLKYTIILFAAILHANIAFADNAENSSIWSSIEDGLSNIKGSLTQTWNAPDDELYIPVNTWHNRSFYSAEKVDSYNEQPWGLGIGKYRYDSDGDWNAFYGMAFLDSHNEIEPLVGYGFEKMWRPTDNVRLGAGYTVGLTMRQDMHYIPIPIILPIASIEYKKIAVQTTYVPGGNGNGNILFTWLRWQM